MARRCQCFWKRWKCTGKGKEAGKVDLSWRVSRLSSLRPCHCAPQDQTVPGDVCWHRGWNEGCMGKNFAGASFQRNSTKPLLPQLAYLYSGDNTRVPTLWILWGLNEIMHVRLYHVFSINVHYYFYCCSLLEIGVGSRTCHSYPFVSVKQGEANEDS